MVYLLLFIFANVAISLYLEKRKFSLATTMHAISFILLLFVNFMVNMNAFCIDLLTKLHASNEVLEIMYMFKDSQTEEVSQVVFILNTVTWILIASIFTFSTIKFVCEFKFRLSSKLLYNENHLACEDVKPSYKLFNASTHHMMVMRC